MQAFTVGKVNYIKLGKSPSSFNNVHAGSGVSEAVQLSSSGQQRSDPIDSHSPVESERYNVHKRTKTVFLKGYNHFLFKRSISV